MLVFASEPQASHFGTSLNHLSHGRYTEQQVAETVLGACAEVSPEALLMLKLHPLEDAHAFDFLGDHAEPPETKVLRSYPSARLIAAADVVVGMTSMFLLESAVMGVPTISVRPGGHDEEHPWIHQGLIRSVVDPSGLVDELAEAFAGGLGGSAPEEAAFGAGATERVCGLVRRVAAERAVAR
jgi:hypothetical protein